MKSTSYPNVKPVIELGFNALQLSPTENRLALRIKKRAAERKYIQTPDGWFVPLSELQKDIKTVADFFRHEMLHYGEFEIGGGFLILVSPQMTLGIPPDSTFRFAMDLANIVLKIKQGENRDVSVGSHEVWRISADIISGDIFVLIKGIEDISVKIPLKPLRDQFREAQSQVVKFATTLENYIGRYKDLPVESKELKFMFGLDKDD